jgi:hypothetical protein
VRPECPTASGEEFYVPAELHILAWPVLKAIGAQSLSCGSSPDRGYRLMRIAAFENLLVIEVLPAGELGKSPSRN